VTEEIQEEIHRQEGVGPKFEAILKEVLINYLMHQNDQLNEHKTKPQYQEIANIYLHNTI